MNLLALLYAVGVTVWTAARFTPLATKRPFELVDLFGWAGLIPLLVLIPAALLLRRWRALAFLLVPAVVFLVEYGPMMLPNRAPEGASRMRVVTANVFFGNTDMAGLAETFRELDADVVALHELSGPIAEELTARLRDVYPHRLLYPRPDALGMGLLSRLPLESVHDPRLGRDQCSCHTVTATAGGRQVTIINAHPLPPGHSPYTFDPERQRRTIQGIIDRVVQVEGPLVVMGDMNVGDRHRFYRSLRRHLGDAHRDAGLGFGFTWPASRPLVRIDYVLRSDHWGTRESHAGTLPGSDHRYVYADLVLL